MRQARIVAALTGALLVVGCATAGAVATSTPVECTVADGTLSCPLPEAAPATVTVTTTQTVTAAQQPPASTSATPTAGTPPTTSPTTPSPAPGWPDASNTGVPAGIVLTPYAGPRSSDVCYLTDADQVLDGVEFTGCDVMVMASNVAIRNSRINGHLVVDTDRPNSGSWSVTVDRAVVDAGTSFGAAVSSGNLTIRASEIKGGQTIVQCTDQSSHCVVEDSWLHGQSIPPMAGEPHLGGFLNSGGPNIVLRHNRIACDNPNGCTGDVVMLPDFAPITNVLIENNLLMASDKLAYCTYAGWRPIDFANQNHDIVYRDNVFERGSNGKCGAYGPVTGWRDNPGNVWESNTWADGAPVPPAG